MAAAANLVWLKPQDGRSAVRLVRFTATSPRPVTDVLAWAFVQSGFSQMPAGGTAPKLVAGCASVVAVDATTGAELVNMSSCPGEAGLLGLSDASPRVPFTTPTPSEGTTASPSRVSSAARPTADPTAPSAAFSPTAEAGPYATTGPGTTSWLQAAHWSTLPRSPLEPRIGAAVVWSGSTVFVWGGVSAAAGQERALADGASYDPAAGKWTLLPPSPLTSRYGATAVWTGDRLFVWGGPRDSDAAPTDGALFDPATGQWHLLPPAPIRWSDAAFAVGGEVIVVGRATDPSWSPSNCPNGAPAQTLVVARYSLATGEWSTASPILAPKAAMYVSAVAVDKSLLVLAQDQSIECAPIRNGTGETTYTTHVHGFVYDVLHNTWSAVAVTNQPMNVGQPIWTGREVIVTAAGQWCGPHSCAPPSNVAGARLAVADTAWQPIAHGSHDDHVGPPAWTGAVIVRAILDPNSRRQSGPVDVWDPATGHRDQLANAPGDLSDTVPIWAGTELLFWGASYDGPERGYALH